MPATIDSDTYKLEEGLESAQTHHAETGRDNSYEASPSTLSDVDTEVHQEEDGLNRQVGFQACLEEEMHLCCGRNNTSWELGKEDAAKDAVMSRITSRLENLKSNRQKGPDESASDFVSRSFLQFSNEWMSSFDTSRTKAVRNVLARFGDCIAVGDSNGHVLMLYTSSQKAEMLKKQGDTESHAVGGVTALGMVPYGKSTLLVSGHISGVIRIWERRFNQQWTHCKDISGCHAAAITSLGVVHVGMSMWLLTADAHGRLLSHNVQRFLSITAQALAGISRQLTGQSSSASYLNSIVVDGVEDIGVVLSITAPYLPEGLSLSPEAPCPYVILCTNRGALLVEVGTNGKVEYRSILAGFDDKRGTGVYSAAWKHIEAQHTVDTVIAAISSGCEINTFLCKMQKRVGEKTTFERSHIKCLKCPGIVQGVAFIHKEAVLVSVYVEGESGKTHMALIRDDTYSCGEDVVVKTDNQIECIDTYDWIIPQPIDQLITGELLWNGSLVGGSDVMLLTSSGIRSTHLLSWQQKVGLLVSSKLYEDALLHVTQLYDYLQTADNLGLARRDWPANRIEPHDLQALAKQFASLLIMYVQQSLDDFRNTKKSSDDFLLERDAMSNIVYLAFDICLMIERLEMFYNDIASVLKGDNEHSISWDIFMDVLESTIRRGVYSAKLPPELIRILVENLISRSDTESIEQLLLNLEISSLDLNQIIPLCIKHDLYSVILYVFSQGLKDYKTPAALLFSAAVEEYMSSSGNTLAMKLLVYIHTCFKGFDYPLLNSDRLSEHAQNMKLEMMDFILFSSLEQIVEVVHLWSSVANIQKEQKWTIFCEKYSQKPVMEFLCEVDGKQTLKLLQDLFFGWDALIQDVIQNRGDSQDQDNVEVFCTLSQATVNKLIETLELDKESPTDIDASMMNFILHYVTSNRASLPSGAAFSVLSYLCQISISDWKTFDSCQKSFEDVVDHLDDLHDERIIGLAQRVGFSSAEARIHRKRGHFLEGIKCLLMSENDKSKVFAYYKDIMMDHKVIKSEKYEFQRSTIILFPDMVKINPDLTADLALEFAAEQKDDILSTFDPDSNSLFLLLQSLLSKLRDRTGLDHAKLEHQIVRCSFPLVSIK